MLVELKNNFEKFYVGVYYVWDRDCILLVLFFIVVNYYIDLILILYLLCDID